MVRPEVSTEAVIGDAIAAVPAPLLPGAVIGFPVLRSMLPPGALLDALLLWCSPANIPFLLRVLGTVLSLLLRALPTFRVAAGLLLSVLRPIVLLLPLLSLGMFLRRGPVLPGLLLGMLWTILLVLRLLLSVLRLFGLSLSLLMSRFGLSLLVPVLLLFVMVLLLALLIVLRIHGRCNSDR
jgi:hypothetical protein